MELSALLVIIALVVVTMAFIARPLLEHSAREPAESEKRLSALRADYDHRLAQLQELDGDFALGKIEPADYHAERAEGLRQGTELLRQIDALSPEPPRPEAQPSADEDALERRVANLRSRAAGFCGQCGGPLSRGDRFCPRCGHAATPGAG